MTKPTVFIGSSTEGLKVARAIRDQLDSDATVVMWNEDESFRPGQSTLESLMTASERYDFAILVFTADDQVISRGDHALAPRDNVLFELGLFMGRLGRERTFIVYNSKDNLKIPSDFKGINCPVYESRSDNLMADLGKACNQIRREIERLETFQRNTYNIENGILYRVLNAFTSPSYPDIKMQVLNFVRHPEAESITYIGDVIEFSRDLFSDYLHPHLTPSQLRSLRVYFAYYLGDGVPLGDGETPICCNDYNFEGKSFPGQFVVGISNPDKFVERAWLQGRAFSGYANNRALSNCAKVFQSGNGHYKPDLNNPREQFDNYKVEDELSVFTVPVEWRTRQGNARIGVLAVSSKHPNSIFDYIQERTKALAILLGALFSSHAAHNQSELDAETINIIMDRRQLVGFDAGCDESFIRRVIGLRQKIAAQFEHDFIENGTHLWDGRQLSTRIYG
ncbi:MAG: TIR domain-containing protein [Pyrinomonadaceae bacterium]